MERSDCTYGAILNKDVLLLLNYKRSVQMFWLPDISEVKLTLRTPTSKRPFLPQSVTYVVGA